MDFGVVQPAARSGAWEVEGAEYASHARYCFEKYNEQDVLLRTEFGQKKGRGKRKRDHAFFSDMARGYRVFKTATVVFAGMAVEAFLNFYGVKRLDEDFYRENFERLSPTHRKVSAIVASCCGKLLPNDAELLAISKRLAARRNDLVHPKAHEAVRRARPLPPSNSPHQTVDLPTASIKDMDRFFELFSQIDPDAPRLMTL